MHLKCKRETTLFLEKTKQNKTKQKKRYFLTPNHNSCDCHRPLFYISMVAHVTGISRGCEGSARNPWVFSQISLFWANVYLISSFSTLKHPVSMESCKRQCICTHCKPECPPQIWVLADGSTKKVNKNVKPKFRFYSRGERIQGKWSDEMIDRNGTGKTHWPITMIRCPRQENCLFFDLVYQH